MKTKQEKLQDSIEQANGKSAELCNILSLLAVGQYPSDLVASARVDISIIFGYLRDRADELYDIASESEMLFRNFPEELIAQVKAEQEVVAAKKIATAVASVKNSIANIVLDLTSEIAKIKLILRKDDRICADEIDIANALRGIADVLTSIEDRLYTACDTTFD